MNLASLKHFFRHPEDIHVGLANRGLLNWIPDKTYLKMVYKLRTGKKLDLDDPKTISEKLQWLKIYNRRPEYTMMVDKYSVKKYVAEKAGEQYVTPLYGVWDRFEDIDFDTLPDQFVLKCTHDGGPVICTDKKNFDIEKARKIFHKKLKQDYFQSCREWPYKNVKRRIIAEKYIPSLGHRDSVEYKLTVLNGKVKFTTVCTGIAHDSLDVRTNDHFDRDWNRLDWWTYYKSSGKQIEKHEKVDEMIEIAEKLAEGIPYVRVDFYLADGQIFFGEMTFFTWGGFLIFDPPEWDEILGSWLELPEKNRN